MTDHSDPRKPIHDALIELVDSLAVTHQAANDASVEWRRSRHDPQWVNDQLGIDNPFGLISTLILLPLSLALSALRGSAHVLMSDAVYCEDLLARPCVEACAIAHNLLSASDEPAELLKRGTIERVWGLVERIKVENTLKRDTTHLEHLAHRWVQYGAALDFWSAETTRDQVAGRRQITSMAAEMFAKNTGMRSEEYYRLLSGTAHVNVSLLVERGRTSDLPDGRRIHDPTPSTREILLPLRVSAWALYLAHEGLESSFGVPLDPKPYGRVVRVASA